MNYNILAASNLTLAEYNAFCKSAPEQKRFYRRVLIIAYWQHIGLINIERKLEMNLKEICAFYARAKEREIQP